LLNPWVIVQLPFQHAILHQWMVAFNAETLKFQKEVSDLLIITYPSEMRSALKSLSKIKSTLSHFINMCHEYLFSFLLRHPVSPIHSNLLFMNQLPDVLPMLKFILSEKSKNCIKALKRMAWNKKTCKESKMEAPISKEEKNMFNSQKDSRIEYKSWRSLEAQKFQIELVGGLREYFPDMKNVVKEKIIKTGRLSGVSKETILRGVDNTSGYIFEVFRQYKFLKGKFDQFLKKLSSIL
jgi:hypothetical protein